jgi:large subunit ribosomal protein L17
MRNKIFGSQLSRGRKGREALLTSLVKAVVENGTITTTLTKAKAVQPDLEKLMQLVIKNDMTAKRAAYARLRNDRKTTNALFALHSKIGTRTSGFTVITKVPHRKGDGAEMAKIGWVTDEVTPQKPVEKSDKSQVTSEE